MLRRASIVTEQWLYVFDVDATPPNCSIYSPIPSPYKVTMEHSGQRKSFNVKDAAWSRVLGKDSLPEAVLFPRLYARNNISMMLRSQGSYHICNPSVDMATAPGLQEAQQRNLGLAFAAATTAKDQKNKQAGTKRAHPAKQNGEFLAWPYIVVVKHAKLCLIAACCCTSLTFGFVAVDSLHCVCHLSSKCICISDMVQASYRSSAAAMQVAQLASPQSNVGPHVRQLR